MANQYYYTVSSLPMLSYDTEKFMSLDEFFDCCETTITEKDFNILKSAKLIPVDDSVSPEPVLEKWNSRERSLRNELVKMRAGKKGVDSEKYIAAGSLETGVIETAREAFGAPSPLDAELILDKSRWEFLEMLEAGHFFDLGKLVIYSLQLQLLQRKARINKEAGKAGFDEIYSSITGKEKTDNNENTE